MIGKEELLSGEDRRELLRGEARSICMREGMQERSAPRGRSSLPASAIFLRALSAAVNPVARSREGIRGQPNPGRYDVPVERSSLDVVPLTVQICQRSQRLAIRFRLGLQRGESLQKLRRISLESGLLPERAVHLPLEDGGQAVARVDVLQQPGGLIHVCHHDGAAVDEVLSVRQQRVADRCQRH